jgi:hypothetical protein
VVILALLLAAATCHARGPLPDPACTPGAVRTTDASAVCARGSAKAARNVPQATKTVVVRAYGRRGTGCAKACEVDHLISLELGGSNDQKNLWPEPYAPRPGAHEKDLAENYLHHEVCAGRLALQEAQREISTDWLSVYHRLTSAQRVEAAKSR